MSISAISPLTTLSSTQVDGASSIIARQSIGSSGASPTSAVQLTLGQDAGTMPKLTNQELETLAAMQQNGQISKEEFATILAMQSEQHGADGAALGAAIAQPPSTIKTILKSTAKGAMMGVGFAFGADKLLGVLPLGGMFKFLNIFKGPLTFVNKTVFGTVLKGLKMLPFVGKFVPGGFAGALVAGGVIGGIMGLVTGFIKAKKEKAEFEKTMAEAASSPSPAGNVPIGDPIVIGPDGTQVPVDPGTNVPTTPVGGAPQAPANPANPGTVGPIPSNPVMPPGYKSPAAGAAGAAGAKRSGAGKKTVVYTVKPGDTLGKLAKRFKTTVKALMKLNPKITDPNVIKAGQKIRVPRR